MQIAGAEDEEDSEKRGRKKKGGGRNSLLGDQSGAETPQSLAKLSFFSHWLFRVMCFCSVPCFFFLFLFAPPLSLAFSGFRPRVPWALALCVVCFLCLPLLGSPCALALFVCPAWPLAAPWWLPPPPPSFSVSRFSSLTLGAPVFFFTLHCGPRLSLALSGFTAPGALGLGAVRSLLCWPPTSRLSVRSCLSPASRLAVGCSLVVAPPPPRVLCLGFFVAAARCYVPCAVLCCVSLGAVLRRLAARCVARCCAVVCCVVSLRSFGAAACCAVSSPGALLLCGAVFRGVSLALWALYCVCFVVAWWCALLFAALLCAVCVLE